MVLIYVKGAYQKGMARVAARLTTQLMRGKKSSPLAATIDLVSMA